MKKIILNCLIVIALIVPTTLLANKKESVKKVEKEVVDSRESLRAFYTAPPVIPHEVTDQTGQKECLQCHKKVFEVGGRTTVKTPHPQLFNCQQCHVQGKLKEKGFTATTWQGLKKPKKIKRAHEYAPPMIPHRTFLRKNCNACHGQDSPTKVLRGPHPERSNCLQCHLPQNKREF
ncbi:hypothetical protein MNBD_UNCLBAC01-865 [hydrothermal vent metagenome]|uniref:Uncharacterized protein n=1 Tax=hydrothermal vent metagenome TaxID=652676 RepID=A0A3B1DBT5_9ZZZZ